MLSKVKTAAGGIIVPGGGRCRSRPGHVKPPARWERDRPARKPTRDTSRVGTGQGIVPFDGLRERRVAAGKAGATNEIPTTPRGVCGDGRSVQRDPTATSRLQPEGIDLSRVPRMPRWLRQPRHPGRAWYYPFTLASGSDPRHESRVALRAGCG